MNTRKIRELLQRGYSQYGARWAALANEYDSIVEDMEDGEVKQKLEDLAAKVRFGASMGFNTYEGEGGVDGLRDLIEEIVGLDIPPELADVMSGFSDEVEEFAEKYGL